MFKKTLITLTLTLIPIQSCLAMWEPAFYFRADVMGSKFQPISHIDTDGKYKHRAKENITADLGMGFNFPMGFRGELVFSHIFPATFTYNKTTNKEITLNGNALMLRASADVVDLELFKFFVGGGIGGSRVRHEWDVVGGAPTNNGNQSSMSSKWTRNIAYQAYAGISAELIPNASIEVGYLYADYGKTRALKEGILSSKIGLRSHNVFLGLRYEF